MDLHSIPISDIIPSDFALVSLNGSDSVRHALNVLIANNLYAAPVRSEPKNEWLGFLDLADIIHYLLKLYADQAHIPAASSQAFSQIEWTLKDLEAIQRRFENDTITVDSILNCSHGNRFKAFPTDTPLGAVLESIVLNQLHRVALVNKEDHEIKAIVSPSSILAFLNSHLNELDLSLVGQTIEQAKVGHQVVVTIDHNERALVAFAKMAESKISYLALVHNAPHDNPAGICGNISMKDIKLILGPGGLSKLMEPVGEYMHEILRMNLKDPPPALQVNLNDTVGKVIAKMDTLKIHRLYVSHPGSNLSAGGTPHPIGVINIPDILRVFVRGTPSTSNVQNK